MGVRTNYCRAHGGGRRCQSVDCTKGVDKFCRKKRIPKYQVYHKQKQKTDALLPRLYYLHHLAILSLPIRMLGILLGNIFSLILNVVQG